MLNQDGNSQCSFGEKVPTLSVDAYIAAFTKKAEKRSNSAHGSQNSDEGHNYILVCPMCEEVETIIKCFDAEEIHVPGGRVYYSIVIGDKCILIWNDFTGFESADDEYLFEFRRFCTETSIENVRFYFPKRSLRGNTLRIFKQFKSCLKTNSISCQSYTQTCLSTGKSMDLLSFLDTETGKLVNFEFKGTFNDTFSNALSCVVC